MRAQLQMMREINELMVREGHDEDMLVLTETVIGDDFLLLVVLDCERGVKRYFQGCEGYSTMRDGWKVRVEELDDVEAEDVIAEWKEVA